MHAADIGQMIINLSNTMPAIYKLVTSLSYVFGIFLMFQGVNKLKLFAEARMMSPNGASYKGPTVYIACGAMLLWFPSATQMGMETFFGASSPLAYPASQAIGHQLYAAVIKVVEVVGAIAFVRGWVLMSQLANQQSQPGTFAKAMTHIIAGIFAINVYGAWTILQNTLMNH